MSIKIRTFFLNSSYFLKSIWTSGNSFLKDPSSLMMIHPKSNCKQKLTTHFLVSEVFKPVIVWFKTFLEAKQSKLKEWCFPKKVKYFQYPSFWLLNLRDPGGHDINFSLKFMLGKKIAHVWEEVESLIISDG